MVQGRRGPSLAAKALQRRGIVSHAIGQKFEGNKPAEASVLRLIDHAHATRTQRGLDFVGTKFRARGEVHPWRNYSPRSNAARRRRGFRVCCRLTGNYPETRLAGSDHRVEESPKHRFLPRIFTEN